MPSPAGGNPREEAGDTGRSAVEPGAEGAAACPRLGSPGAVYVRVGLVEKAETASRRAGPDLTRARDVAPVAGGALGGLPDGVVQVETGSRRGRGEPRWRPCPSRPPCVFAGNVP
ncbi:hypothetical protein GCM10010199_16060 [Dactylosporangium roseum]